MVEMVLHTYKKQRSPGVLLDDEDALKCKDIFWNVDYNGYVVCRKENLYLHRFILDAEKGKVVDHINGNKLDNRRCNLRICTVRENVINSKISKNNTSGFPGVSFRKDMNKWRAYLMVNRKQITFGWFDNIEDAIEARILGEQKHFGEFAPQH